MGDWWKYRDNLSSFLSKYDLNLWENKICDQVMNSLLKKTKIVETKISDDPLSSFLKHLKSLSSDITQLKSGDIIGILRVSTIRQFKILRLELLPQSRVISIEDNFLRYTSDEKITREIPLEPLSGNSLERGVYIIADQQKIDRIYTDLSWYETRFENSGWQVDIGNTLFENLEDRVASLHEASGYIPSQKERNDPRWKTALTVDVTPNSIKDNARRLGSKIARDGRPPLLRK
jgi:hypothetical protein